MLELSYDKLPANNESETHSSGVLDELQSMPQYFALDRCHVPAHADVCINKRPFKSCLYRMPSDAWRVHGLAHHMLKLSYGRLPTYDSAESRDRRIPDELHAVPYHEPVAGGDL